MLRDQGVISPRGVPYYAVTEANGIAPPDSATKQGSRGPIQERHVRPRPGGLAQKIGRGPGARWKIVPPEPALL
jgi:hypothetical protein